ncbi:hypothetical protein BC941DRAFT_515097 [Chlamydoabsidia padenii]|nr:hypothetical protein BC941DRAFT_515097 [Chlamydoabsidia padenii]
MIQRSMVFETFPTKNKDRCNRDFNSDLTGVMQETKKKIYKPLMNHFSHLTKHNVMKLTLSFIGVALMIGVQAISISEPTPGTTYEAGSSYMVRWNTSNDTGVNPDDGNKTKTNSTTLYLGNQAVHNVSLDKGAAQIRIPDDQLGENVTLVMKVGENVSSKVTGIEIKNKNTSSSQEEV